MKTSTRIRAIIVLILGLLALSMGMKAQNVIRKGNQFEQVDSQKSRKTEYTYKTRDGKVYPVFLSPRGKAYINRVSKNGKEYKQYLPKVTEAIKNDTNGKSSK